MTAKTVSRLLALALWFCSAGYAQSPILGVLEDVPGSYAGEKHWMGVRPVFHKDGAEWKAYGTDCTEPTECTETQAQFPDAVTWTIGFDGKKMGVAMTKKSDDVDLGSHVGLQPVVSAALVPHVGQRSKEFSGFLSEPVYRPLVANSQPYVSDPDSWKPGSVPPDLLAALRKAFRQKYTKLCYGSETEPVKPLKYSDAAIVAHKAYRSKSGWWIVWLQVANAMDCGEEPPSWPAGMNDPWFVVAPHQAPKFLSAGMWLVDAGDYDNDGHSELVFSIDQYNRGGYILYWADFSKSATFSFTYH